MGLIANSGNADTAANIARIQHHAREMQRAQLHVMAGNVTQQPVVEHELLSLAAVVLIAQPKFWAVIARLADGDVAVLDEMLGES